MAVFGSSDQDALAWQMLLTEFARALERANRLGLKIRLPGRQFVFGGLGF